MLITNASDQASSAFTTTLQQMVQLVTSNATLSWLLIILVIATLAGIIMGAMGKAMKLVFKIAAAGAGIWMLMFVYYSLAG